LFHAGPTGGATKQRSVTLPLCLVALAAGALSTSLVLRRWTGHAEAPDVSTSGGGARSTEQNAPTRRASKPTFVPTDVESRQLVDVPERLSALQEARVRQHPGAFSLLPECQELIASRIRQCFPRDGGPVDYSRLRFKGIIRSSPDGISVEQISWVVMDGAPLHQNVERCIGTQVGPGVRSTAVRLRPSLTDDIELVLIAGAR
jgi:hypothetical protein